MAVPAHCWEALCFHFTLDCDEEGYYSVSANGEMPENSIIQAHMEETARLARRVEELEGAIRSALVSSSPQRKVEILRAALREGE